MLNTIFLSTPSARRATTILQNTDTLLTNFYPRPPRGGRRYSVKKQKQRKLNFYPRPPRGGRRVMGYITIFTERISIHALREEGDVRW